MCPHVLHAHALPQVSEGTQVMSQAQKNQGTSARVRSTPPPIPPRHSHIAPLTADARSTPPPPPMAALRRLPPPPKPSPAPRLSVPPPAHLAIVPLWDDANLPLRPAMQQGDEKIYWIGSTTVSVAVGALVAASLMTLRFGDYAQILPHGSADPVAHAQPATLPLAAAALPMAAPVSVQSFEAEQPLEIDLSDIEEVAAVPQPIVIPELTVTSRKLAKSTKAAKHGNVTPPYRAPKQRGKRGKRGRTMPAAISEAPTAATESAAEALPSKTQPVEAAESQPTPAPSQPQAAVPAAEIAVSAPALPENLSRAQVKSGLDSVRAKVLACANGTYGRILANVTISAQGQASAVFEGTFAGTKAAACMAQKISGAKFPAFSGPDISVRYPYSF